MLHGQDLLLILLLASLARIIVYSMAPDSIPVPYSNAPTPIFSPLPSGVSTPYLGSNVGDYLSHSLGKKLQLPAKPPSHLGGSKALDSLARMIASTESFFHPTNSGSWTTDVGTYAMFLLVVYLMLHLQLSAFIKYIVFDFNKRDIWCLYHPKSELTLLFQDGMKNRNLTARRLECAIDCVLWNISDYTHLEPSFD
jgi:hypothetical protein